ncbi:hypothetical protein F5B19DRAFT_4577 [Rostrohypoxylon terebratum]|nr:hypothetical protein F5B19DRAFT_4577 [Rostrohypoxylon terebratum]
MEPASAFGLASSIVQMITFTSDIISKTRQIHHSAQHSLVQNSELASIAQSLQLHNERIRASLGRRTNVHGAAKDLLELSESACGLCKQFIDTVEDLKTPDPATSWNSFRQALRSVWKEKDIVDLAQRLDRYRAQIDSSLLAFMQEQLEALTNDTRDRDERIEQNLTKILASLDKQKNWQAEAFRAARESIGAGGLNPATSLGLVSASLTTRAEEDAEYLMKGRILESLNFSDMQDRYEHIPKAHQKTFEWVFKDPPDHTTENSGQHWDSFTNWLTSGNPLYWITGKPGAGKSTLMKFLSSDSRLHPRLQVWQGGVPLYIGHFFFWNSGTAMQMSKIGLLRSLLHQTISKFPNEIPALFAARWQYQELFGHDDRPWSWPELSQAFSRLVSDQTKTFFFLIDGLDEFGGDCDELANYLLQALRLGSNLKLCVASRPWLVFEDAFKLQPSLRVEHLTIADIQLFTSERLMANTMFARLQDLYPMSAKVLMEEVSQKASGVFLWVTLVVKSLLDGLRDGDTVDDLRARLLKLPPDLRALFQKILADLQPDYFEQASRIFQAVRAAHLPWKRIDRLDHMFPNTMTFGEIRESVDKLPLTLLSISFIDEDVQQALFIKHFYTLNRDEQIFQAERMRRRLYSRCKGLLEVPAFDKRGLEVPVQYLHRTVKDFLEEDGTRGLLASSDFDAHLALCATCQVD